MKLQKTLIHLFLFVFAFIMFLSQAKAQEDSLGIQSFARFQKNIQSLQNVYAVSNSEFYPGKFQFSSPNDVRFEYEKLNFELFPHFLDEAYKWYQLLNSLPDEDKKNFVRFFSFYENHFETTLKKAGLPVSLKFLPLALSGMNPFAPGIEGRAGVWQLTHFQTILNGGEINRLVDQRLNIEMATQIAVRQLKKDFTMFENPELSIMAFLCGNTKVKNTLYIAGENANIGTVLNLLPDEVKQTVAVFQVLSVFLQANRFKLNAEPFTPILNPDTVKVNYQIHFQQVEKVIGISVEQLKSLNPQYKFLIVPCEKTSQSLVLPHGKKDDFLIWNDSIYHAVDSSLFEVITQNIEYPPAPNRQYVNEQVKDLEIEGMTKVEYRLKTGDVLGIIAEKYNVKVSDLKYWNNIYNERRIQAGQKINIFVPNNRVEYYSNLDKQAGNKEKESVDLVEQIQKSAVLPVFETPNSQNKVEHVVKSGESPFVIAKQYEGVTPELILEWNNIDNPRKIQIGQKLILYPKK